MAVLWEHKHEGVRYEVRSAGRSVRLYENGVLHTQYHPERVFVGSVWDLLSFAGLMLPHGLPRRVLVLGVGGGVVIRQLHGLLAPLCPEPLDVIGVELNPLHIRLAREWFGLTPTYAELVQADAASFVRDYQGPPFDLIVDDVFAVKNGEPERAILADDAWCQLLCSNLSEHGALTTNFASVREFRASALSSAKLGKNGEAMNTVPFRSAYSFTTPHCDNVISACFRGDAPAGLLESRLQEHPLCQKKSVLKQLRYRARKYL